MQKLSRCEEQALSTLLQNFEVFAKWAKRANLQPKPAAAVLGFQFASKRPAESDERAKIQQKVPLAFFLVEYFQFPKN